MALQVSRIYRLVIFFILFGSSLVARLFYLQIIESDSLASQSLSMRIQEVPIEVARGEIVDRNGMALTNTAQHNRIVVFPGQIQNMELTAEKLAALTGFSQETFISQITANNHPFKLNDKIDAAMGEKN